MKHFLLIGLFLTSTSHSVLYSENEISDFLQSNLQKNSLLIGDVLTSKQPEKTLKSWLLSNHSPIEKEYYIHALLNHLSSAAPEDIYLPLLEQLSQYQAQAVKIHAEAHHANQASEPVFNIASKAAGVLNVWQMKNTQREAAEIFQTKQHVAKKINQLLERYPNSATYLGIKQALNNLNDEHFETIKSSFMSTKQLDPRLHSTLVDLNQISPDPFFAEWTISQVNQAQAEKLYRHVLSHWPKNDAITWATQSPENQANPSFVASLLAPFVDDHQASEFLLKQLVNPKATHGAAFALSKSQSPKVWKKMQDILQTTDDPSISKSIQFSFKQNLNPGAQVIYQQLAQKGEQS